VAQSADEKRGYQRGYNRAGARYWDRVRRVVEIARGYQQRLTDTDKARTCATCRRWTRGGSAMRNDNACMWGSCSADFDFAIEARMWSEMPMGSPSNLKPEIITQPEFGCVSWLPRSQ
jgi:hypothetical protein